MKFEELLQDLKKRRVLGKVLACRFTICTIAYFLHPSNKHPSPYGINRIICAEIPNQSDDPELYNLVKSHIIYGSHGLDNDVGLDNDKGQQEFQCKRSNE
ncbi:hypothetical protein Lal_00033342 [Lupinus albus]|nr:hypothetical protein Lal_00033342 [Lupinus albus]